MLDEIGALFVDVGGTLIRPRAGVGGAYARLAKSVGGIDAPVNEVQQAFAAAFVRRREEARRLGRLAYGRTEVEARRFWRALVGEVFSPWTSDGAVLDEIFQELYAWFAGGDAWEVFPDAEALLAAAAMRGLPVVAVSNWDARLNDVLRATGLSQRLHAVVASWEVGAEKPDRRMFEAALARLPEPLPPSDVLHVGDSFEDDVAGARAVGLRAILVDRAARHPVGPDCVWSLDALAGV